MEKNDRSAHYTIAGYYYQFDYTISNLLNLGTTTESVTVEGIEDIDVHSATEMTAIQVKYYENTKYAIDLIREPIVLMLQDFKKRKDSSSGYIKYTLYIYLENGWDTFQQKLTQIPGVTNEFSFTNLAEDILTGYTIRKDEKGEFAKDDHGKQIRDSYERHTELGLNVTDLNDFSVRIIRAVDTLELQRDNVKRKLREKFKCSGDIEVEYYYNNSFAVIADIARKANYADRSISNGRFVEKIDKKTFLFNEWYASLKSKDNYLNFVRKRLKTGKALDVKKRKFFFIGKEFLTATDKEVTFVSLVKNIISETYELDKAFSTKNRVSTLVLDVDDTELERLKRSLDESKIHFNDGNEHRTFSVARFNEDPIVNTTKVDRISKASYQIKIISFRTFKQSWDSPTVEHIKPIDVVLFFSAQDPIEYFKNVSEEFGLYIMPPSGNFSSLSHISELFFKLIVNDDYFKIITVLPNLIQVEVTNPIKFAMKNENFSIGSYMKITDENQVSIIGILQSYKIRDVNIESPDSATIEKKDPSFIIDIQPVGYMENGEFTRGGHHITIPPSEVEVADEALLKKIFKFPIEKPGDEKKVFTFGSLSNYLTKNNQLLPIELDGNKFFNKHIAVVGSTGSGKSCTVARILQEGTKAEFTEPQKSSGILNNSHIIIFDLHNEYSNAFPEGRHLSVKDLILPYWLMNSDELQTFLLGNEIDDGFKKTIVKKVIIENKKMHYSGSKDQVTYDLPIYFDINEVKRYVTNLNESKRDANYNIEWRLNTTDAFNEAITETDKFKEGQTIEVRDNESVKNIDTTSFLFKYTCVPVNASQSIYNGQLVQLLTRLDSQMKDERLDFLFKRSISVKTVDLPKIIKQFIGQEIRDADDKIIYEKTNVTIIDLSGIPFEVLNITVALISRLVFSFAYYLKKKIDTDHADNEIKNPFLLVYEEAHNYIPKTEETKYRSVREAVERVAKEGRKYGLSAMIVSQRPSEISETILSQCNTFVIMRITNPTDQSYIKRLLPDSLSGVTDNLSILQPREALIIGDAIPVPTLVKIDELEKDKLPKSNDVAFIERWRADWDEMREIQDIITSMTEK